VSTTLAGASPADDSDEEGLVAGLALGLASGVSDPVHATSDHATDSEASRAERRIKDAMS
jgi:hypothetical protein